MHTTSKASITTSHVLGLEYPKDKQNPFGKGEICSDYFSPTESVDIY